MVNSLTKGLFFIIGKSITITLNLRFSPCQEERASEKIIKAGLTANPLIIASGSGQNQRSF